MQVQSINQNTFKGYDARPLRGFLMSSNCRGIAEEMKQIGDKEGFKIFAAFNPRRGGTGEFLPPYNRTTEGLWAQDVWSIVKDKLLALECDIRSNFIKDFFGLKYDFTELVARRTDEFKTLNSRLWALMDKVNDNPELMREFKEKEAKLREIQNKAHIPGGNIFSVMRNGRNEIFVGAYELQNYSLDEIGGMYCSEKVIPIPQMDYHIDLFLRPLNNGKVLLADDEITYQLLKENSSQLAEPFRQVIGMNRLPQADEVAEVLNKNGYEVVRVPGRIYAPGKMHNSDEYYLKHYCNYMNANVIQNPDGDLVYITNKSNINKAAGFDFEAAFIESISPYVRKDKVYFIKGEDDFVAKEMLTEFQGGIHCACTEVP